MRSDDHDYFDELESKLTAALEIARDARERGGDPTADVEIPIAKDMADRVENILGIDGVAERVREMEADPGLSREEAALELAADFADGTVGDYDTRAGKVEGAVRTAVALLTEGVVAAPIEGIDRVEVLTNDDGTEFINIYYAGPIRSAGGTAQALSVLVADYTRALIGIDEYKPRDDEIERYSEELALYDDETGLQYAPSTRETNFIARHIPIMLDGEPTGQEEVSGFRDLDRVGTNHPRGGMCLVLGEGIAQKAPKIQRYTSQLDEVDWPWLQTLIDGDYSEEDKDAGTSTPATNPAGDTTPDADRRSGSGKSDEPPRPEPSKKYLRDLIAGRPVFSHPSEHGGFRLRYGRARNHGYATAGVHPATMHLVDDFLATGTQIKTERPGKAAGIVPVDTIDGPTVRLANGDVRQINDPAEAREIRNGVAEIIDLGEYLVNYGEFIENNHPLAPASYTPQWWKHELEMAGADIQALEDSPHVDTRDPTATQVLTWVNDYEAPLHPKYTYLWHDIDVEQFTSLAVAVHNGKWVNSHSIDDYPRESSTFGHWDLEITREESLVEILETLLVEHTQQEATVKIPDAVPLVKSLGLAYDLAKSWEGLSPAARTWEDGENAIKAVNEVAPFEVRERAPTRVGCRMGRPEKSEKRELSPAVHSLFPIGDAGGSQRDIAAAGKHAETMQDTPGVVDVTVGDRQCSDCGTDTFWARCPECNGVTEPQYRCFDCDIDIDPGESSRPLCPGCQREVTPVQRTTIDVNDVYRSALDRVGERDHVFEVLKGVQGLSSAHKIPEPLEKGILRAKNGVSAFKDGTVRFDMTDLPVTAVRAAELDISVDQLKELGYTVDVHGDPLTHENQLVELRVQDVVLSDGAADHMMQTAEFVDDLLDQYYDMEPFYELDDRTDLVGELVFGMAPHTSAAVVGRVIGFTSAAVGYAHPYFHAAKRRNCFHPDTKLWYEDTDGSHQHAIERVVEPRLENPTTDDFGTQIQHLDGEITVPSVRNDGTVVQKPVTAVSKHPAPTHLVTVQTEAGREITVTPDHEMQVFNQRTETFQGTPASNLTTQDHLAVPRNLINTDTASPIVDEAHHTPGVCDGGSPDVLLDQIASVHYSQSDVSAVYCLTVADTHSVIVNGLAAKQCDGDEDCILLLMDGLLNFSKKFLPDKRGGRMDAPLVMSSRIDPAEIDDEAHNMDIVSEYPYEFYAATREMADPESVEELVKCAENTLDTDDQYRGFNHTHDTSNIALGPDLSAYKTLGSMMDKMDAQLELSRKLRAVDETDVAERVIEYHFLPDLLGNLRAFSRQETRCLDCGTKYRRMPLTSECRQCGGDMTLTVHEGSVKKYMDTARRVAEEYDCREYTQQRLLILDRSLESIFEDDTNKQSGIADFM